MRQLTVKTRSAWRKWLVLNHDKQTGVWLVFYKKHTGKPTLDYEAAVEEALCFGWIDSIIKKLDDQRYVRKMTPRKPESNWSALNRQRAEKIMRQGLITPSGLARINEAKASGHWESSGQVQISLDIPVELEQALAKQPKAKLFFDQLAPSYRKQFIGWIAVAKQQATRERRVKESMALLEQGKKLGMK
jgi:uncharacterized protein YdeI (YjbR/CyaY-like superfamily)